MVWNSCFFPLVESNELADCKSDESATAVEKNEEEDSSIQNNPDTQQLNSTEHASQQSFPTYEEQYETVMNHQFSRFLKEMAKFDADNVSKPNREAILAVIKTFCKSLDEDVVSTVTITILHSFHCHCGS